MKPNSNDPRAIRTRLMLRQALMQIVVEKPFRDLTISNITKYAGVNRATFYLHYDDKYDLLKDCAKELFTELRKTIESEIDFDPKKNLPEPFIQHVQRSGIILHHFQQYNAFYKAMFGKDGDPLFYNMFRDSATMWIRSVMKNILTSQNQPVDEDFIEMMVRFQSAGNFDVISWWLENDMRVPIDIMAERLAIITMPPLMRLIQGDTNDL